MLRLTFAAALAGLAAAQNPTPVPNICQYSPQAGVTFNVCNLGVYGQDYIWNDPLNYDTKNQTYVFNIGLDVNVAGNPNLATACAGQGPAPVYNVTYYGQPGAICTPMAISSTKKPYPNMALIDTTNPARGWTLTYFGGNCPADAQASAQFSLNFLCNPGLAFPPAGAPMVGPVVEMSAYACIAQSYSVSMAGCPIQCPMVNGVVCGGNGVCDYDSTATTARCFCYNNWMEADCQTPRYPVPSGAIAGATIGGILLGLVGIVGASYYLGRRHPKTGTAALEAGDGFYN